MSKYDATISNARLLVKEARKAKEARQYKRALKLARRALAENPQDVAAGSVLCATLRRLGKPRDALGETSKIGRSSQPQLATTRAAAMCDLEMWEEAKAEVAHALRVFGYHGESFAVVQRIKAARPDLYPEKK